MVRENERDRERKASRQTDKQTERQTGDRWTEERKDRLKLLIPNEKFELSFIPNRSTVFICLEM